MEKVKIYCAFHKPYPTVDNSLIVPILMGNIKKYASILNYPTDDVGDNIADLNYTFCELTALYWIWKNDKSSEIIGLCHYRRYFDLLQETFSYKGLYDGGIFYNINMNRIQNMYKKIKTEDVINQLEGYDFLMADFYHMRISMKHNYCSIHYPSDWALMHDCLKKLYPDYYRTALTFFDKSTMMPCNMFIATKKSFHKMMEWLFPLLFEIYKHIDLKDRSTYQKRAIGFMSERLVNLYIEHTQLKVKRLPVLFAENVIVK